MRDDVIRKVALDIGNNSIKLLIGEMSSDFTKIAITDYVKVKHAGLRKSEIYDINSLSEAVLTVISKEQSVELSITRLLLALGCFVVGSTTLIVNVSFPEKEI